MVFSSKNTVLLIAQEENVIRNDNAPRVYKIPFYSKLLSCSRNLRPALRPALIMDDRYQDLEEFIDATIRVLATLTPREELVLRNHIGIGSPKSTQKEIAKRLSVTQQRISQIKATALRKLRHPDGIKILNELTEKYQKEILPPVALQDVIETVDSLTFDLINYLKKHQQEIEKIPWNVFEHLVAEFLASQGFIDVRLVGRDSSTSADIYAAILADQIGTKIRFFVEVKREKKKVGINIINSIFGAISLEKAK